MNITPIHNPIYDCYDGIIATICAANNWDFFMIFASKLFFRCISTNDHSVEECFSLYSYDYSTQILEKAHGIQIAGRVFFSKEELYREVENEKKNKTPLSLKIDTYQCPWSEMYCKKHMEHEILVIGTEDDTLICLDPYLTEERQRLKLPDDQRMFECKKYRFLHNSVSAMGCLKILQKNLLICRELLHENFTNLKKVTQNIHGDDVSVEQMNNYLLAMRLNTFQNNRICYLRMLDILYLRYGFCFIYEIRLIKEEISDITKLRTVIVKSIIKKTIQEKMAHIIDMIECIYKKEKELIESLLDRAGKLLKYI